jgi:hypothetical protein
MPRIVRSIQTYQNNLNSFPNLNSNSQKDQYQYQDKDKDLFYSLGVKTFTNNRLGMPNSYSNQPSCLTKETNLNEDIQNYHNGAKYGATKYICSLQSGKMHKLIHNNS